MIEQIANDISRDNEEREIVSFGLERLKVAVIALLLVIISGVILHESLRSIFLIVCLLPLRQNAGGYHMQSSRLCAVFSYLTLLVSLLCIRYIQFDPILSAVLVTLSAAVIMILSPVGTENHQLDMDEKRVYGKRARIICGVESALFFVLLVFNAFNWGKVILLTELITAFLLILGKIKESGMNRLPEGRSDR